MNVSLPDNSGMLLMFSNFKIIKKNTHNRVGLLMRYGAVYALAVNRASWVKISLRMSIPACVKTKM